ncbi:MAG: hypothetical protein ACXWUR_05220 [Allosphingosinicella sp.]
MIFLALAGCAAGFVLAAADFAARFILATADFTAGFVLAAADLAAGFVLAAAGFSAGLATFVRLEVAAFRTVRFFLGVRAATFAATGLIASAFAVAAFAGTGLGASAVTVSAFGVATAAGFGAAGFAASATVPTAGVAALLAGSFAPVTTVSSAMKSSLQLCCSAANRGESLPFQGANCAMQQKIIATRQTVAGAGRAAGAGGRRIPKSEVAVRAAGVGHQPAAPIRLGLLKRRACHCMASPSD